MVKKGLAKALERKMGQNEGLLTKIETKAVDSSLLMNDTRRAIFQFICNHPGVHLRMISRSLNFSTQTAIWHLEKLVSRGMISKSKFGNKNHYYPLQKFVSDENRKILALFYNGNIKRTYLHLMNNPDVDQKHLISELNIYQQLLSIALITLKRHELVDYETRNKTKIYHITNRLDELVVYFDQRSLDFENLLDEVLKSDGVNPKVISKDAYRINFEIDSGGSKRSYLKIQKNPVRAVLKL